MATIAYYDLTSAECFALHEIVRALPAAPAIEWRGVQGDPALPERMRPFDRRARSRVETEILDAQRFAPDVRFVTPRGRPNTRRALQAVASVERMHVPGAGRLRELLFRAYWWDGADVSDVATIRRLAEDAGVPPWVDLEHQATQAVQVGWELQWAVERLGGVPRVIRDDGQILWSLRDAAAVGAFLGGG
ncbi:MAG TPA: hypothetical protein VG916_14940 [Gemmatimonadaceae bacterium]|nr:hypothetical protein [Gemmatimonadaceae bacterium]